MGTRSTIALEYADGSVSQVYSHWDGYLEHNGSILQTHYSDPWKLRELIDLGDLSSLAKEIGTKHDFDNPPSGVCNFYGRDRGETGVEARRYANYDEYLSEGQNEEYDYILRTDGIWYVRSYGTSGYIPLVEAFEKLAQEA